MNFKSFFNLFKGGRHARRTEESVPGGNGRERGIVHSLESVRERAVSDLGGIRMLAAQCADERGGDTGTLPEDPVCCESRALITAAKKVGCLMDAASVPGTRYTIRTGESEVRLVQPEQVYYKIKNPFAKLHLKKHPPQFVLFEHVIHNILFPECRLDFLGVAEDLHEARLVFRQNAVRAYSRPSDAQIEEYLRIEAGLVPENRYCFGNEVVFVTDVGQDSDNVLLDNMGRLRFVDPIIGFKTPVQNLLSASMRECDMAEKLISAVYNIDLSATFGTPIHPQ